MCRIIFTLCQHWCKFILVNKTFLPVPVCGFAAGSTEFPSSAFVGWQWGRRGAEQRNAIWAVLLEFCAVPLQWELASSLMKWLIHERDREIRLLCKLWCSGKNIKARSIFCIIQGCAEYWLQDYFCHLGAGIKRHSFKDKKQYEGAGDSCISQATKTERVLDFFFFSFSTAAAFILLNNLWEWDLA